MARGQGGDVLLLALYLSAMARVSAIIWKTVNTASIYCFPNKTDGTETFLGRHQFYGKLSKCLP